MSMSGRRVPPPPCLSVCLCIGGLYRIAVTTHRTAPMVAPLPHCGPAKNEVGLHIKKLDKFVSIRMYAGDNLDRTR